MLPSQPTPSEASVTNTPAPTETPAATYAIASIMFPQDGDAVGRSVVVRGTISGLRSGLLCVKSQAFSRLIYPQGEIISDPTGYWVVESVYQSVGYTYETFVVVTDNPDAAGVLASEYYRVNGMDKLPSDTFIASSVIIVGRE